MSLEPARFQLEPEMVFDGWVGGGSGGEPVLLLHGFPQTARAMLPVAQELVAANRRVVVPDQRGYSSGARPLDVAEYSLELLVGDALGLLDAAGIDQVHLVGHDWGALVAWTLAANAPERVKSLTAISVPHPVAFGRALEGDLDQQQRSAYMQLFQAPGGVAEQVLLADDAGKLRAMYGPEVPAEAVGEYVARLSEPGALSAAINWHRALSPAQLLAVPPVSVPTTFVWGASDVAIGRVAANGCAEFVGGDYEFVELPDQGHWLPEAATAEVVAVISRRIAASA
jgi:pimeloyl-ACP methyl ester carboxylesterase